VAPSRTVRGPSLAGRRRPATARPVRAAGGGRAVVL